MTCPSHAAGPHKRSIINPRSRFVADALARLAIFITLAFFIGLLPGTSHAQRTLHVTPDNYLSFVPRLKAGDTLRLAPGTYRHGLPLRGLTGSADAPIVITGPEHGPPAVFVGRDRSITVSLIDVAHVTLRHLTLDGQGVRAHGIVAESRGRYAHHITLENLVIRNFDAAQAFNGISTKTPTWAWVIRDNHIHHTGTGLYLGNSDGRHPFIGGLIEGNHIEHTIGYNMQIKHQAPRPTDLAAMPTTPQQTIIRNNIFDKSGGGATGERARPNLLLGHWPLEGPGQDDVYLVSGNVFYQNPTERLFQAEGNVHAWSNHFVNVYGEAVSFQPHNDVPRDIRFFENEVVGRGSALILRGAHTRHRQSIENNRIHSERPPVGISTDHNYFAPLDMAPISSTEPRITNSNPDAIATPAVHRSFAEHDESQDPFHRSQLARLANQLPPGRFTLLAPQLVDGGTDLRPLLRGYRADGSSAPPIDTWTDSAQWDSLRKKVFFQGLRQSNRFLVYDALADIWHELDLDVPNAPPRFERYGHLYGRTALDAKRGHFYRLVGKTLHRFHIDTAKWERFGETPLAGYISIDWHEGLDLLIGLHENEVHGFRDGHWYRLGTSNVHGYHSSAKFNPKRNEMLFIGGNHSRRSASILDGQGRIQAAPEVPFEFSISRDNLTYDPESGHFLVLRQNHRELWEFEPDSGQWQLAMTMDDEEHTWPFSRHGGVVPVPIEELGIILWLNDSGPQIYRHRKVIPAIQGSQSTPAKRSGDRSEFPEKLHEQSSTKTPSTTEPEIPERTSPRTRPTQPALDETEQSASAKSLTPSAIRALRASDETRSSNTPAPDYAGESISCLGSSAIKRIREGDTGANLSAQQTTAGTKCDEQSPPIRSTPTYGDIPLPEREQSIRKSPRTAEPATKGGPALADRQSSTRAILLVPNTPSTQQQDAEAPSARSKLYDIAGTLKPGEWRRVETGLPPGVNNFNEMFDTYWFDPNRSGTYGLGWSGRQAFDPETGRLVVVLQRSNHPTSVVWLEPDLQWKGWHPAPDSPLYNAGGRRPYDRLMTVDGHVVLSPATAADRNGPRGGQATGRLVRAPFRNLTAWENFGYYANLRHARPDGAHTSEWHPDIRKYVLYVMLGPDTTPNVLLWGEEDVGWKPPENAPGQEGPPGRTLSSGYNAGSIYNPLRREVLLYGGSSTYPRGADPQYESWTYTIDADGKFKAHGPSGIDFRAGGKRLTYNPVNGNYLLLDYGSLTLWEGDPPRGVPWRIKYDWRNTPENDRPFSRYDAWHGVTHLPGTDVLIWRDHFRGIILYRATGN